MTVGDIVASEAPTSRLPQLLSAMDRLAAIPEEDVWLAKRGH